MPAGVRSHSSMAFSAMMLAIMCCLAGAVGSPSTFSATSTFFLSSSGSALEISFGCSLAPAARPTDAIMAALYFLGVGEEELVLTCGGSGISLDFSTGPNVALLLLTTVLAAPSAVDTLGALSAESL